METSVAQAAPPEVEARCGPVILFDGVCNLCSSAVQWILDRDRRQVFRFASLQSRTGEAAIRAAEGVRPGGAAAGRPDSIVLLDEDGVHLRSDAIVRVAKRLGFPWSLAAVALLLPRGVRDSLYDWVARHRYRWFGQQSSCRLPTPELRGRFLDADELAANPGLGSGGPLRRESAEAERPRTVATVAWAFAQRSFLSYLVIYCLCFPIGAIPFTESLPGHYRAAVQAFVTWVAKAVFGIAITAYPGGSGDTTYNYIELSTFVALALLAGLVASIVRRGAPVAELTRDRIRTYVRYYLAVTMLVYGWGKVVPLQMPAPGPDRLLEPVGDLSPMGILWTFMGASPAYEIFAGLGEVIGGFLLLWRRTTQIGALVSAAVLANVVVLNFCYDVPVKLFSSHLLLLSLFVLAPHVARLFNILVLNLPAQPVVLRPFPVRRTWLRRTLLGIKLAFVAWVVMAPAWESWADYKTMGSGAPHSMLHGFYRVESFSRDGVLGGANPDPSRWVRAGVNRQGTIGIQRADGSAIRYRFALDPIKKTFSLTRREDPEHPIPFAYSQPEKGLIRLEGAFEGAKTVVLLRAQTGKPSLLMTRGFHWINEVPLNR